MSFDYPRPQFRREAYQCLDGTWNYSLPNGETGVINVPYVYQCEASGIGKPLPEGKITYERTLHIPKEWEADIIRLHFNAVDYEAKVLINGHMAAHHVGGQIGFHVDLNDYLVPGSEQSLKVEVSDRPNDERIPRGKQTWKGKGHWIFYTPTTGIWQTVWMEPVPKASLQKMRFTPDVDHGTLEVALELEDTCPVPCQVSLTASLEGVPAAQATVTMYDPRTLVSLDILKGQVIAGTHFNNGLCWSPDSPTLFDLEAKVLVDGQVSDTVQSYFGMRKVNCVNGRMYLNNHPCPQKLVLDQGYWPGCLLTAPNTDAFKIDIEKAKAMGFNGCRKHEKAEDPRFLYWADKLGFMVWGAMASFYRYDELSATRHMREWLEAWARDYNHPSIVCWDVLNESWGVPAIRLDKHQQQYANALYAMAHAVDGTRPVVSNDGWEMTYTDVVALHSYQHGGPNDQHMRKVFKDNLKDLDTLSRSTLCEHHQAFAEGYKYEGQPIILSEYGGMALGQGEGDSWGYNTAQSTDEFLDDYEDLIRTIAESGLFSGFCYTQLTDVEQEQNGILTVDREFKVDPDRLKKIHDLLR